MSGRWTGSTLLVALAAALAGLGGAVPAAAQQDTLAIDTPYRWIEPSVRVGLVGGYVQANRGVSELGPAPSALGGARFRARISSPISLEFGALYASTDRFVIDPRLTSGPAPVDTVGTEMVLAEAAMQFALTGARTWNGIQPYALVGGGLLFGVSEEASPVFADPELSNLRFDLGTTPMVQVGAGFEIKPAEQWGIGLEFRDHLWRLETPEGFFEPEVLDRIEELGLRAPQDTDWTHNLEFSVGVWRYF